MSETGHGRFCSSCYSDLNVTVQEGKKRNEEVLQMLANYGYECAALSYTVTLAKKMQLKSALELNKLTDNVPRVCGRQMRVLRRITVSADDASLLHVLSSPAVESYELLAIRPGSEKVLQQACSVLNVDIISINLTERLPFMLKRAQIGQAIERGIHFEICYSPAIRDATFRRNTLANAMELVKVARGKNIIVSSEAEKPFDLRAPADVVNLCCLFGLKDSQCKATVTTNCRAALMHAAMRRNTAKGVVSSTPLSMPQETQQEGEAQREKGEGRKTKRKRAEETSTPASKQRKTD